MIFFLLLLLSALFISCVAGYFSITGWITIFAGAPVAAGLMGASLELGKIMVASWLYRYWSAGHKKMRLAFIYAIFILSLFTSIGIFGYLSHAHLAGTEGIAAGSDQITLIETRIQITQQDIMSDRTALKQLDQAVTLLMADTTKTERAIQLRRTQQKERATLTKKIDNETQTALTLEQQKATMSVGQRQEEVNIGPAKYVSQLIFGTDATSAVEKSVRLMILLLITVFDPLAILLILAANMQIQKLQKDIPTQVVATQIQAETQKAFLPAVPTTLSPPPTPPPPGMLSAHHP